MLKLFYVFLLIVSLESLARSVDHYPEDGHPAASAHIVGVFEGCYGRWLPLSLQLGLDPTFSAEESKLIKDSAKIFVERALNRRVLDCAFNNSTKNKPESRDLIEAQLYSALSPMSVHGVFIPSFAFVARYWDDSKTVGLGYVGLYFDKDEPTASYPDRHYLHVALNSDHLGPGKSYRFSMDAEYWAGVLAHEFLHNLGYQHTSGHAGSFIQEYGHCVSKNGVEEKTIDGEVFDREVFKDLEVD